MANTIRIKRRASPGSAGAPSSLENAELAFNENDDILYYGKGTGGAGGTATTIPAIGGVGAFVSLGTTQTISGNKTFTGTLVLDGQTWPSADGTVNQVLKTNGSGALSWTTVSVTDINVSVADDTTTNATYYPAFVVNTSGAQTAKVSSTKLSFNPSTGTLTSAILATGNLSATANTLSSTNTNGNIVLDPNGTGTVDVNSSRITSVSDPTQPQDAATKAYVDAYKNGLDVKDSVVVASTAALTVTATSTTLTNADTQAAIAIDGVSLALNDRVLIKDQATSSQNGIYTVTTVGSGATNWVLTRAADADATVEVTSGLFVFVEQGSTNADSGWILTTDGTITIGTTGLTFTQFSGAGQITAGSGLTKTGNTLNVGAGNGITVNADDIALASTTAGAGLTYTTGVLAVGAGNGITVNADDIALASTAAGAGLTYTTGVLAVGAGNGITVNADDIALASTAAGAGLTYTTGVLAVGAGTGITVNVDDVALTGQALAVHNLATNGIFVRTAANTVAARSVTTSGTGISVSNGNGVSGDPTLSLSTALSTVGGLTPVADSLAYYTGAAAAALTTLTTFGRSLIDDADATAAVNTLGILNLTFDGGTF